MTAKKKKEQPDPWEELGRLLAPAIKVFTQIVDIRTGVAAVATRLGAAHHKKEGLTLDADEVRHLVTLIALLDKKGKE